MLEIIGKALFNILVNTNKQIALAKDEKEINDAIAIFYAQLDGIKEVALQCSITITIKWEGKLISEAYVFITKPIGVKIVMPSNSFLGYEYDICCEKI